MLRSSKGRREKSLKLHRRLGFLTSSFEMVLGSSFGTCLSFFMAGFCCFSLVCLADRDF